MTNNQPSQLQQEQKDYIYSDISPVFNGDNLVGYNRQYDVDAIKNSLMNLFLVQKLEVPGKPQLGNPLNVKVFELFDSFSETIIGESIKTMIRNYEPRVDIKEVRVTTVEEMNRLIIEIDYYVIINNRVIGDTIYIPFAHNTRSFIDGRQATYIAQK